MDKLLSICTAAYNAEAYIDKMLLSILNSKYLNQIEIIAVDDGSRDATLDKLRKYEKKYPTILKVIHKKNGGSGSARNCAFEEASGKYIKLIDSDDWVVTEKLDSYMKKLESVNADMVLNNFFQVHADAPEELVEEKHFAHFQEKVYALADSFPMGNMIFPLPMHGITYRTAIFQEHKIKLSEGVSYVDVEYITLPMPYISTIVYIEEPFYVYQCGVPGQSVDRKVSSKKNEDRWIILKRLINVYNSFKAEISSCNCAIMKSDILCLAQHYFFVYFNTPSFKNIKVIKNVDREIKLMSGEVYEGLSKYKSVRFLRKTNYLGYYLVVLKHMIVNH